MTDEQRPATPAAAGTPRDPLSMSTDNTPEGRIETDTVGEGSLITQVRDGMNVVDALGNEIGTVRKVRMGDPAAVTTRGEDDRQPEDLIGIFANALFGDGSNVPESTRHELIRTGFIQIDSKRLFESDHAAAADQIAGVSGDTVTLSVDRDALIRV